MDGCVRAHVLGEGQACFGSSHFPPDSTAAALLQVCLLFCEAGLCFMGLSLYNFLWPFKEKEYKITNIKIGMKLKI